MRVMQSKFIKKTNLTNFSNGVACARCAGPKSAFVKLEIILFYFPFSMHHLWLAKGMGGGKGKNDNFAKSMLIVIQRSLQFN